MKKIATLVFAIIFAISANAQQGITPAEYAGMTFLRTEYRGGNTFVDVYQSTSGSLHYASMECESCPKPTTTTTNVTTTPANVDNRNNNAVYTYDLGLETRKVNADIDYKNEVLKQEDRKIAIQEKDLDRQEKADKVTKKQGASAEARGWVNTGAAVADVVLTGLGYKKTTVNTNVFTTSTSVQPGRGYDAGGITPPVQNPNQSPVIDYTLGQNQNQNQQGGGNGGDQGGISPCGPDYIWLNGQCIHK